MSGIYLTVFSRKAKDALPVHESGSPHLTLFHGQHDELIEKGFEGLREMFDWEVTWVATKQNSFFHEQEGKTRYDVFLVPDEATCAKLDALRQRLSLPERQGWHLTYAQCWSEDDLQQHLRSAPVGLKSVINGVAFTFRSC